MLAETGCRVDPLSGGERGRTANNREILLQQVAGQARPESQAAQVERIDKNLGRRRRADLAGAAKEKAAEYVE